VIAMTSLTVPPPVLVLDPPGGPAALEKPVTVQLAGLAYPDATAVASDDVRIAGALVYRGTAGSEEVWDEAAKAWVAAPVDIGAVAALTALPLSPPATPGDAWTGTLVAVGQTDSVGSPRFDKAVGGVPVYRLRAIATAVRTGVTHRGLSDPSPDLWFVSVADQQRFAVEFDTGHAADAGSAQLVFKDASLASAGYLEIRAAGGHEIEIASTTGMGTPLARITLTSDGDIHVVPAPGRRIVLDGPLDAGEVTYQPSGGGARSTL
jgi:hypothetical protein